MNNIVSMPTTKTYRNTKLIKNENQSSIQWRINTKPNMILKDI
jgi:hypothetical protein